MTPDELKAAARRCLYAKQFHGAGHVSTAMLAVVVQDAAALAEAYTKLRAAAERALATFQTWHVADDADTADILATALGIVEDV